MWKKIISQLLFTFEQKVSCPKLFIPFANCHSLWENRSSIPFQIVQAVLKHLNYPDSLGTAVLINSTSEKQQLSAVDLWTVMAKRKELTENLRVRIVAAHNLPMCSIYNCTVGMIIIIIKLDESTERFLNSLRKEMEDWKQNTERVIALNRYHVFGKKKNNEGTQNWYK